MRGRDRCVQGIAKTARSVVTKLDTWVHFPSCLIAKAKDITPSIVWRREAWKDEALDDLS